MEPSEVVVSLARTELFRGVDAKLVDRVGFLAETRQAPAGQHLFFEGDLATEFFVLVQGRVRIYIPSHGDEVDVALATPGDLFGEGAIFDGGPRLVSALALEPTTVLTIARTAWLAQLDADPELARRVLTVLGSSLRRYVGHALDCLFLQIDVPDEPPASG
jgi:CRP/FNR family transcriptional regulator